MPGRAQRRSDRVVDPGQDRAVDGPGLDLVVQVHARGPGPRCRRDRSGVHCDAQAGRVPK